MEDKTRYQIYKYRSKLGLSMKELADKVGVSESTISFWESGTTSPRVAKAERLAEIFGISVPVLAFGDDVFSDHNGEDAKIINAINNNSELKEVIKILLDLTPDDLERVLNVVRACQNRG